MNPIASAAALAQRAIAALDAAQPLAQLAARLYVAQMYEDEYHVPLLPPEVAALMGTAGELALPVLLAFGLAGRFAAAGLSVVNVVAVISLAEIAPAALQQHVFWGSLLAGLVLWGPGRWSLDRMLAPRLWRAAADPYTRAA
jgi:putative oxidoreductase